ncbi:recombinase family protein, partial [Streptomyces sp. NPDC018347]|uniref:recombinase family protein n=1 Tax=Streptomyces sp. NPDC018347 TaxID=3157193 RepID=UPI00340D322E
MELGYARVSTSKQDLTRQIDALAKAGIDPANIYVDKKSGTTTERPGLQALLECARGGDHPLGDPAHNCPFLTDSRNRTGVPGVLSEREG